MNIRGRLVYNMLPYQDSTPQGGQIQVHIFLEGFYLTVSEESCVLFIVLCDFPNLFIIYRFPDAVSHPASRLCIIASLLWIPAEYRISSQDPGLGWLGHQAG